MRHWLVLAAAYALVAALIVPGPLGAQEEAPDQASVPGEAVPGDPAPVEPVPAETTPAELARRPPSLAAEPAPVPAEPAPAEPAPAPAEPAPAPAELVRHVRRARGPPNKRRAKRKPTAVAAATENVTIVDFEFTPASITIQQGDTVTWTNDGPTAHSATASDGSFDTGIFSAGGSRSETFDEAGTFSYICTPHPNMTGTITVEASSSGDDGSGDGGGGSDRATPGRPTAARRARTAARAPRARGCLPTGADALLLAILGLFMLALDSRSSAARTARRAVPPGRIGW